MMYCELWGVVASATTVIVGSALHLILSKIVFDGCVCWLSFNWCISLICMGKLILNGVITLVLQHIHYNLIVCCNTSWIRREFENNIKYTQFWCTRNYFNESYSRLDNMASMCSTVPIKYRWLKGYIYRSCFYHHQIGSIHLSHCFHIFPSLCAWDVCCFIFCHLLYIHSGKTGNLFSLVLCSLWWV